MQSRSLYRAFPKRTESLCAAALVSLLSPLHENLWIILGLRPVWGITASGESHSLFRWRIAASGKIAMFPACSCSASSLLTKDLSLLEEEWEP